MSNDLVTSGEAAEELGVSYEAISDLVRAHGITTKPVPRSPNSKGLDARDMAVLRRALGLRKGEKVPGRRRPLQDPVPA